LLVLHGTSSAYTVTAVGPRDGVNTIGPFVPSARWSPFVPSRLSRSPSGPVITGDGARGSCRSARRAAAVTPAGLSIGPAFTR